jgi:plastocyanin
MAVRRGPRGKSFWRRGVALGVLGVAVVTTSGCLPNTGTLKVTIIEQLAEPQPFDFDQDTYRVPRGEVDALYLAPASGIPHTLRLRQDGGDPIEGTLNLSIGAGVPGPDSAAGTFTIPKGTYEMYCDVGAHAALGMTATLVVY